MDSPERRAELQSALRQLTDEALLDVLNAYLILDMDYFCGGLLQQCEERDLMETDTVQSALKVIEDNDNPRLQ